MAMASPSGCSLQSNSLDMSDSSCAMGESKERDYVTAPASEVVDLATMSLSFISAQDESILTEGGHSGEGSASSARSVEEQIETSKVHWSELSESVSVEDEEVAKVSNMAEFKALQLHPTWGSFFQTFGYDLGGRYRSQGTLVMGKKFAEGGQAEIFEAKVHWLIPENNEKDLKARRQHAVKVFKTGTFLKHLKSQLPNGLLKFHAKQMEQLNLGTLGKVPRYYCQVHNGILLKDGRFAFLMQREHVDLWNFIEHNMKLRRDGDSGPFSKEYAEMILYRIALGLDWLHSHDIVHRDLKASNVLVSAEEGYYPLCSIADYECSVGVVGTGFFRAPEILQVCKDRSWGQRQDVFSREADVYGYGMVCYEVLTGKLPFQDHPLNDDSGKHLLMDLVIKEHLRPEVPKYIEGWTRDLLTMCWQSDPKARPRVGGILNVMLENLVELRRYEKFQIEQFGKISRSNFEHDM